MARACPVAGRNSFTQGEAESRIPSLQLSFAVVPLVIFTSIRALMGGFVNSRSAAFAGIRPAVVIAMIEAGLIVQLLPA